MCVCVCVCAREIEREREKGDHTYNWNVKSGEKTKKWNVMPLLGDFGGRERFFIFLKSPPIPRISPLSCPPTVAKWSKASVS